MPKYYCDYCDVFLTHDSSSVRKAHNSGRNHLTNVRDYYAGLGHDKAQNIIDEITRMYESGAGAGANSRAPLPPQPSMNNPPPGGFRPPPGNFGPPPGFPGPPPGFGGPGPAFDGPPPDYRPPPTNGPPGINPERARALGL